MNVCSGFGDTDRPVLAVFLNSLTRYTFLLDDPRSPIPQDHSIVLGAGAAPDHHASRPDDHREVPDLVWQMIQPVQSRWNPAASRHVKLRRQLLSLEVGRWDVSQ